jgi:hypothetical protein
MKIRMLAIAFIVATGFPGAVFAADCSAVATVAISKNLTANWRMLKVDVSSDSCQQLGCYGIVTVTISERLPKSSDVDVYQLSFPYDINMGSKSVSFMSTRRFGADKADRPALSPAVSSVSCVSR